MIIYIPNSQKKSELIRENGEVAHKILELSDGISKSKNNIIEIDEAITAGNKVLESIHITLKSFKSAQNLGTWDLLGGGFLVDIAKHSKLDNATSGIERTQMLLRKFKTELTDVNISSEMHIDISGFAKFADFFFDGLIADWFVQSKITQSKESVLNVKNQVQNILQKLEELKAQDIANLKKFNLQIDSLINNV